MIPLVTTGIVLGLASILSVLWPLLELKPGNQRPRDLLREFERLLFEKERLLTNLKDLELDQQMKKISLEDYEELKAQFMNEAGHIYAALEKVENDTEVFKLIDKDVAELEKELA